LNITTTDSTLQNLSKKYRYKNRLMAINKTRVAIERIRQIKAIFEKNNI